MIVIQCYIVRGNRMILRCLIVLLELTIGTPTHQIQIMEMAADYTPEISNFKVSFLHVPK